MDWRPLWSRQWLHFQLQHTYYIILKTVRQCESLGRHLVSWLVQQGHLIINPNPNPNPNPKLTPSDPVTLWPCISGVNMTWANILQHLSVYPLPVLLSYQLQSHSLSTLHYYATRKGWLLMYWWNSITHYTLHNYCVGSAYVRMPYKCYQTSHEALGILPSILNQDLKTWSRYSVMHTYIQAYFLGVSQVCMYYIQ